MIATAAHVFQDDFEPKNYVFVRGLVFPDCLDEKGNIIIPHENVFWSNKKYRKLRDETSSYSLTNSDWALIQIDRHHTSSIDIETDHVTDNQAVYCLGHPLGLLMKRSYNAKVIQPHSASNFDYYETQLDAFVGNSGSPVFDAKSHNLVGIFVRGRVAIVEGPGGLCKTITPVCTETQGHECQKISPVADALELV